MTAVQRPVQGRTLLQQILTLLRENVSAVEGTFEPGSPTRGARLGVAVTTVAGRALTLIRDEGRVHWRLAPEERPERPRR